MKTSRRASTRLVAALMAGLVLLAPFSRVAAAELTAPVPAAPSATTEEEPSTLARMSRMALGFAITSGIKYALGGLGPAKLLPFLSSLSPALAAPALIAFSMAEAAGSIAIFNAVAGIEKSDRQVLAFILASAASAIATPFLLGLGPIGATLVANAGRLVLFNLIARREDQSFAEALFSVSMLRPGPDADGDITPEASTEGMPPDYLWAKSPVSVDGSLVELHRRVQESYDRLVVRRPQLDEDEFRQYTAAKASLERALAVAATAP